ncbi:unnamed protein product [Mytilus edulis]|uniref:Fibrinogen C-terminal domain-containing protein n=1 Tax=Mytilus edulis TaxID=6550 RepID=A0A8S3S063_MYTED|nr:unnamed protein product [Mytilus edulis]
MSLLFALNSSLESKDIKDVRTYRESEEKTRVDDILHELQGICLQENELRDVTQLKKDTQSILKSMAVYKDVVKMNKQLKDDIKWILEESRGEKEVSRIIIQKRYDGSVNFQRSWTEYENGFGKVKGEYWLGDSLKYHNGMKFSAVDRDNDEHSGNNACVKLYGPWWHKSCFCHSALNNAIRDQWYWKYLKGRYAQTTMMMIRKT